MDEREGKERIDEGRREALRKSAYALYATPAITAVLVERASAGNSWNHGSAKSKRSKRWWKRKKHRH